MAITAIRMEAADNQEFMDTKANLLYKLGRTEEAIQIEERAVALNIADESISDCLEKMKSGVPT